ncbi:rhamnogalacturonan acetylesterase [Sphingobacterium chuzhouense]|uniref:Rhamnogalacturonan acetylesterase n=1 Tax=Sphingobacterium chuzhouense TaxID=1742264 RepID=A0ABR7XMT7_9SPHI|nr:rhamnogalacturonan acetylesterase [Sphingobacterium chuzhouense]MBD1420494.1 rhamnogalacturonan acetylesterase [Sphingobacterium chuzhouense]
MTHSNKIVIGLSVVLLVWSLCSFVGKKDRPTLFLIGDSTVKTGRGDGSNGQWGWGSFIADYFNPQQIDVQNRALGGTSSRTFYNNPKLWQQVLDSIQPGDYVIMQFGHNDASPIVDTLRARGTIKGNGNEYREVKNPLLHQKEMVYSYGYYLRLFVKNIHDKEATAIICSPIPRNRWEGDKVIRSDYAIWAKEAAEQADAFFVPLEDLIVAEYEKRGKEEVGSSFFGAKDHTHTLKAGAELNASLVAGYLSGNSDIGLKKYLKK